MSDDAARRRDRKFAASRLTERSEAVAERSEGFTERSEAVAERSEAVAERSEAVAERSEAVAERGEVLDGSSPTHVAADIFRRAVGLGGHLVVAFVAPVGASSPRSRRGLGGRSVPSTKELDLAKALVERLIEEKQKPKTLKP